MNNKKSFCVFLIFASSMLVRAQSNNTGIYAYLFEHMVKNDYGHIYYSVSTDGLKWQLLNDSNRVNDTYRGHPNLCIGRDGRYYQIGVQHKTGNILLWVSSDLITWDIALGIPKKKLMNTPRYKANPAWWGAPKMFYDNGTDTYLITWHAPRLDVPNSDHVKYWASMRTFYITTKDFKTYTEPKRLFHFNIPTLDVMIRKEGPMYYAFFKDEREASAEWPTGKSVRMAVSRNLTGPYSYPSTSISPNYHEAPTIIPKKDGSGYYMYYEQYPGIQFGVSEAPALAGPWFKIYQKRVKVPDIIRYGCMCPLTKTQYEAIIANFPSHKNDE